MKITIELTPQEVVNLGRKQGRPVSLPDAEAGVEEATPTLERVKEDWLSLALALARLKGQKS